MKDKIKIYLPVELKNLLLKDAKNFGFIKPNGDINTNSFLNTLLFHYYEEYMNKQKLLKENIHQILNQQLSNNEMNQLLNILHFKQNKKSETVSLSLKPTKNTEGITDYIEQYLLNGSSLSSYYHEMFSSYASLPQDKREIILFKDTYEKINHAIKENKSIVFTINKGQQKYKVIPYRIVSSYEEMHNYVLSKSIQLIQNDHISNEALYIPIRLSKIENIMIHDEMYIFNESELKLFDRALRNGVQFIYHENDKSIKVKIKEGYGTKMFDRFYVHRPIPIHIENNIYTFDCSYNQIINYFARFGSNATILEPVELKKKMQELHCYGYLQYKKG